MAAPHLRGQQEQVPPLRLRRSPSLMSQPSPQQLAPAVIRRYLWTDAFGVMNFISLAGQTGDCVYLRQADALIAGDYLSGGGAWHA